MKRFALLLFVSLCSALSQPALAESTGGSIGKREKSIFGGEASSVLAPVEAPRPAAKEDGGRAATPCSRVPGSWTWWTGERISLNGGGSFRGSKGNKGNWSCSGNTVAVVWQTVNDTIDRMQLSPDGSRMNGSNQYGLGVSAARN
jgi:hypothetical protein